MEPPSPIGSQQEAASGPFQDDPLSCGIQSSTILILSRPLDEMQEDGVYAVTAYYPTLGPIYLGRSSVIES